MGLEDLEHVGQLRRRRRDRQVIFLEQLGIYPTLGVPIAVPAVVEVSNIVDGPFGGPAASRAVGLAFMPAATLGANWLIKLSSGTTTPSCPYFRMEASGMLGSKKASGYLPLANKRAALVEVSLDGASTQLMFILNFFSTYLVNQLVLRLTTPVDGDAKMLT